MEDGKVEIMAKRARRSLPESHYHELVRKYLVRPSVSLSQTVALTRPMRTSATGLGLAIMCFLLKV